MRPFFLHPTKLPPAHRRHTEERLKLAASGLQLLALALFGAAWIAPLFNPSLAAPLWTKLLTASCIVAAEVLAMYLLRCISFPED